VDVAKTPGRIEVLLSAALVTQLFETQLLHVTQLTSLRVQPEGNTREKKESLIGGCKTMSFYK
jgi:hypothetical protein